jgi:hypothetical protein
MKGKLPSGWRQIPRGRSSSAGGLTLVLNRRTVSLTSEVRKWFTDRGYERVAFAQSDAGEVALVGTTEQDGYALKRTNISGGIALRRALGIADTESRRYTLSPSTDFEGLILGAAPAD